LPPIGVSQRQIAPLKLYDREWPLIMIKDNVCPASGAPSAAPINIKLLMTNADDEARLVVKFRPRNKWERLRERSRKHRLKLGLRGLFRRLIAHLSLTVFFQPLSES
jgi:hypothetical protein